MKSKLNLCLASVVAVLLLVVTMAAYASYTKVYTDLIVENLVVVKVYPERENPEDPPPPMYIGLGINVTLTNASGDRRGYHENFELTEQEKTQVLNFTKTFVQQLGAELDVNIPAWAQP